ncbi:MAG: beta-ketoacyl-ACP synthase II [Thermodesulfobacteriota bacterium]|jgi:3-oxoacyl-[acyl-carrier-protein] synthase II|nr:MAG: beta-ketoacyl-ACP synthase II [Thermodesulfobacteriota bacterium]
MRRVVITGVGPLTPVGIGKQNTWKAICEGKSGIDHITKFDATGYRSRIAGEVKGFKPEEFLEQKEIKRTDLFVQYAVAATKMALGDANFFVGNGNAERTGVIIGTGLGGLNTLEKNHKTLLEKGQNKVSPFLIPMMIPNMAPGQIAIFCGAKGPNTCVVTACASGTHAIGEAFKVIQQGCADAMITGGTEATITPLALSGFCNMKALSAHNNDPKKASRPFDKNRDGFVIAEGAGIIILEELELAKKRGANIYCEILGYGLNGDAYHITAPSPGGEGAMQCIKVALEDAKIAPEKIDYINAHGTSTPFNDLCETIAIKKVFTEHSKRLMVSSTKSMTGHPLGAAGGMEAIFAALAIKTGIIPPTINYEIRDPECDLDYVPNHAREGNIAYALSNSFGFGGTNACLVFKKFE